MRTKHLLFTFALGATFAACSSEENFNIAENNAADAKLSIRPVADVEIVLPGENANTRMALGTGARPVWGTNDKLGAAVIDVPTYTSASGYNGTNPITQYNVVESYGCNNAFSTTDGGNTWASEHPMVEGNYLFYAPYQQDLAFRSPLEVRVPAKQDATGLKTALSEFYNGKNIVQIGYKFITGGEKQKPSVPMYNIFAYPKFTIKNNFDGYLFASNVAEATATQAYNGAMKVDYIELVNVVANKTAKTDMVIGGKLQHSNETTVNANHANVNVATTPPTSVIMGLHKTADEEKGEQPNGFTTDGAWNSLDYMLEAKTADFLASADRVVASDGVITTLTVNQTIEYGESIDIYAVMPASTFNYTNNQLSARVYVTIGDIQYVISEGVFKAASTATLNAEATKGYSFTAKGNSGLTSLTFMSGQSLPAEALYVDGEGYKKKADGVGDNLFTIELKGGQPKNETADVQIALRTSATAETGIKTTDDLITMIKTQAPNGTNWVEGTTSNATQKAYSLAKSNTVEINSALIDALATNNQKTGGKFAIETIVPISNDVKVVETTASSATFESVKGNKYVITLTDAVAQGSAAKDKYVIVKGTATQAAEIAGAVVIVDGYTWTITTADPKVKSLHIASTASSAVDATAIGISAGNICNYGTLKVKDVMSTINNAKDMEVAGTLTGKLTNNGTIKITNSNSQFKVEAGTGTILQPEANASSNISFGDAATKNMIYVTTSALATDQITKAVAIPNVTAIKATGAATILRADIAMFGALKHIIIGTSGLTTSDTTGGSEYDLTGFTIALEGNATWTGTVNQTTVKGVYVAKGTYTLTLTNISVNGTTDAVTGGIISANGTTGKWNGGASN